MGYSNDELSKFAETGNRMIFNDAFSKLKNLYNGAALKGSDAQSWDGKMLSQEQNLIQPLYANLSSSSMSMLSEAAKQQAFGTSMVSNIPAFPANWSLSNVNQRWAYGMGNMNYNIQTANMPNPGTQYKGGTMFQKFKKN